MTDPSPDLAQFLAGSGIDINALMSGAGTSTTPLTGATLLDALTGSSMAVTGRAGLTGQPYAGTLPSWAQNLPQQVYSSPDFDPYLGAVSQQGDERVFMGSQKMTVPAGPTAPANKFSTEFAPDQTQSDSSKTVKSDSTITALQAQNLPYTWDEAEVADAMKKMRAAGMNVTSFDDLVNAWGTLVNRAAMTYSMSEGAQKVTPWDVLDLYKSEAKASGALDTLNGSTTTTSRNVTDIDEGEAFATLQSNLSQLLGRDPSDQETRDYTYRMNQLAASNPSISKTVTDYKNGRATSSSTHTNPGFTSADMAQQAYDQAQNDPGYAEYHSASYLYNAALSALGPIGG